jgi:hypothetical protein
MQPQAINQAAEVYNPAIQAIQSQQPAIQQLYQTLMQGLQAQQTNQTQNVLASADQRGVGRAGLAGDVGMQLGAARNLAGAQVGVENAASMAQNRGLVGQAMAGRGQAAGDFNTSLTNQSIENQSNQLAMTDMERKAQLDMTQNQRNFEIQKVQAAQAASKAYASAANAAADMDLEEFVSLTEAGMKKKMGGDGFVSPETFKQAIALWSSKGLPVSEFINKYSGFINKSHIQDYFSQASNPVENRPIANMSQLRF